MSQAIATSSLDPLRIRARLGRDHWTPAAMHGPDGWRYLSLPAYPGAQASVIVTCADHEGSEWVHASIAHPSEMPTYDELQLLHLAVWPEGWAYQVFAPPDHHVNIHPYALHLWGRLDGAAILPNFGRHGTI